MRRPDAEAARGGGDAQPNVAHMSGRLADMAKKIDRREGCQRANNGGKCNQK
jgi:hypothetical protein